MVNVFQTLYEKIEISLGEMINLTSPIQFSNDWSHSNTNDIVKFLTTRDASELIVLKFKTMFDDNHPEKTKELNNFVKALSFNDVTKLHREAKNYLIIKSLYLPEEVETLCHEILSLIYDEIIDFEIYMETKEREYFRRPTRDHKIVREKATELKTLLRKNLTPKLI